MAYQYFTYQSQIVWKSFSIILAQEGVDFMIISRLEMDSYRRWRRDNDFHAMVDINGIRRYEYARKTAAFAFIRLNISLHKLGHEIRKSLDITSKAT
jgi:hypothetical protein